MTGDSWIPDAIHADELTRAFDPLIENGLHGKQNAVQSRTTVLSFEEQPENTNNPL